MALQQTSKLLLCRGLQRLTVRSAGSVPTIPENEIPQEVRDLAYPKIGKREIVGFGMNGSHTYIDNEEYPFPGIRFREETPEMTALREKEKGDWSKLSIEEKKALYRHSFCQTFAEMQAPTGDWKAVVAGTLLGMSLTLWMFWFCKQYVYPPMPSTITREWMEAEAEEMIRQRQGRLTGISSKWDYEKNEWK